MPENAGTNLADIVTENVEARAADGAMVPLSIAYKRGLKRDGSGLTLLEGYGASAVIFGPWLDLLNRSWLEHGESMLWRTCGVEVKRAMNGVVQARSPQSRIAGKILSRALNIWFSTSILPLRTWRLGAGVREELRGTSHRGKAGPVCGCL